MTAISDEWVSHVIILSSVHSWHINGFVTRFTWRVPLVNQELLTIPGHMSSSPVFSGVWVTRSLVLCVCFVDRCLSFCSFSFSYCVVCSSIYGFWIRPLLSTNSSVCRSLLWITNLKEYFYGNRENKLKIYSVLRF